MPTANLILTALRSFHGPAGIDEVRDLMPGVAGPRFDAALLALADGGRVILFSDVDPASIPPARLARLLRAGRNVYTTVMIS